MILALIAAPLFLGEVFQEFDEGVITFAPTFKYDPGTDNYDSSSKQRVPSYTDRILFRVRKKIQLLDSFVIHFRNFCMQ